MYNRVDKHLVYKAEDFNPINDFLKKKGIAFATFAKVAIMDKLITMGFKKGAK